MAKSELDFDLSALVKKIGNKINMGDFLTKVAFFAMKQNRARILKGDNISASKMPRYSSSYERAKRLSGRSTIPNLTLTGNLLKSMVILIVDLVRNVAIVGFAGSSPKTKLRAVAGEKVKKHGDNVKYHKNFIKATQYRVKDISGQELNKTKAWFNLRNKRNPLGLSVKDKKDLKAYAISIIKSYIK